jgi:hypothetical protein
MTDTTDNAMDKQIIYKRAEGDLSAAYGSPKSGMIMR